MMFDKNGCSLENLDAQYTDYFKTVAHISEWVCRKCDGRVKCQEESMSRHYNRRHGMRIKWGKQY